MQYEGALYHILNRGNYRRDVFETAGAAQAFIAVIEEAGARYRWRIHAYAVMRNHYHLAVETPQANLVDGMHWLQGTIATRFNRLRAERGHLFQGRYQSILVEDFAHMARLANYIHLNPVRAGIVPAEQAASFRWSSLHRFTRGSRFENLHAADWLATLGLSDSPKHWQTYLSQLAALASDPAAQEEQGFSTLSSGWAIGTSAWREAIARDSANLALSPAIEADQLKELKTGRWTQRLDQLLADISKGRHDLRADAKSAPWKITLADRLRKEEGAAVEWIARELHMGKAHAVRSYLSRLAPNASALGTPP